ncbi:hypothetical protein Tsubulata_036470 [Turnera subulata]|uniref:Pentatricopeptide repeat-containing protein n=1 Tax=Turnera subulata TaxID=218843 RepID=A0A9Q0JBR5_9ROSI|nr:hypothetical protein Tsubulata_036470 [Turnera subulata]
MVALPQLSPRTLISGLCKVERFGEAYSFVKEKLGKEWKPDMIMYSLLLDGLCRVKKIDVALRTWHQVHEKCFEPDITILMHGLCSTGKIGDALRLYSNMKLSCCVPNLVMHNALVEGLCKA